MVAKQNIETLKLAILAMRQKIIDNENKFADAPLTIEVEMGDGRNVQRANPMVQEYRALVKDYSSALKTYEDLTGEHDVPEVKNLEALRNKFKVAK